MHLFSVSLTRSLLFWCVLSSDIFVSNSASSEIHGVNRLLNIFTWHRTKVPTRGLSGSSLFRSTPEKSGTLSDPSGRKYVDDDDSTEREEEVGAPMNDENTSTEEATPLEREEDEPPREGSNREEDIEIGVESTTEEGSAVNEENTAGTQDNTTQNRWGQALPCNAALFDSPCVNTYDELRTRITNATDNTTIVLCAGVSITISSQLEVDANNMRLCCGEEDGFVGSDADVAPKVATGFETSTFVEPRCLLDASGQRSRILNVYGDSFSLEGVTLANGFVERRRRCGDGGNMQIRAGGHHYITNCLFKGGDASDSNCDGGNLRVDGVGQIPMPNLTVVNTIFMDGVADKSGGAMLIDDMDRVVFSNCTIKNNFAVRDGGGGGSFNEVRELVFERTLWTNNTVTRGAGGALYAIRQHNDTTNSVTFHYSDFVGNKAGDAGDSVFVSKEMLGDNSFVRSINSLFDGNNLVNYESGVLII